LEEKIRKSYKTDIQERLYRNDSGQEERFAAAPDKLTKLTWGIRIGSIAHMNVSGESHGLEHEEQDQTRSYRQTFSRHAACSQAALTTAGSDDEKSKIEN
jgi:hypothetical protein